ncbi:MAG: hypothetical protein KC502_18795, partial [Myxococcales bacterium]|nr:hypothetical protein [Myxococcales bacterium]
CDDKNPCTSDACDLATGCSNTNNSDVCDDGSACTDKDACADGKCGGQKKTCEDNNACTNDSCDPNSGCKFAKKTGPCDDGTACTEKDACADGKCAGSPKTCNDNEVCTADSCDPKTGNCVFAAAAGGKCTDGNACTNKDACTKDGKCAGTKVKCEDGKQCTDDPCDPKKGCAPKIFTKKPCDDGSVCTKGDTCDGKGKCVGNKLSCEDNNPCTNDVCDAKTGCQNKANTDKCSDGDDCTKDDVCSGGKCTAGNNTCQCKVDGDCAGQGTNLCNGALVCTQGKCVVDKSKVVVCKDDNNACTVDTCTPKTGKCEYKAVKDLTTCDADGSKCTVGDSCQAGKCTAGKKLVCDDSKPCTADSCDKSKGCVNAVIMSGGTTKIDFNKFPGVDGKLGTEDDMVPVKDTPVSDQFNALGLKFGLVGGGSPRLHISGSLSKPYAPNVLRPVDPKLPIKAENYKDIWVQLSKPAMRVKIMVMDVHTKEASALVAYNQKGDIIGKASHAGGPGGLIIPLEVKVDGSKGWIARVVVDLTNSAGSEAGPELYDNFEFDWLPTCSDNNACTEPDVCDRTKGACLAGAIKSCNDGNQCTKDSCDPKIGCAYVKLDKAPCEDGNKCTESDVCVSGTCTAGKKKACDDGKPCTLDACDPKLGCVYKGVADGGKCSDGNACTTLDVCKTGKCVPGVSIKCDDGDLCTTDSCDPKAGCKAAPIPDCGTKPLQLPYVESFACGSASSKLWKLNAAQKAPSWAVDATPAKPAPHSPKCSLNFNNGTNYTCPSGASKVTGTADSPMIDLTEAKLPELTFWLGGDWGFGTSDDVQLLITTDGKSYTMLANYNDGGLSSNIWVKKTISLTSYAGKTVGLRFRFASGDCSGNTYTGAFVDDIGVVDAACTGTADCDDANACTSQLCDKDSGKCSNPAVKDGLACTDGNLCTTNVCTTGKCVLQATKKCADDSNACTQGDVCSPKTGKCTAVFAETCNDFNPCTTDACNKTTGACSHSTLKTCAPKCSAATDCFDNNPCTIDACGKDGVCAWAAAKPGTVCGGGQVCGKANQCVNITAGWARNISAEPTGHHYCVTTSTGEVACWGRNNYYQTGVAASTSNVTKPAVVPALKGVKRVETGRYHSCALTSIGEVYCWGRNNYGQTAPGIKATVMAKPFKVPNMLAVRQLALGIDYTCALHADRTVSCWGYNFFGQLGMGNTTNVLAPKKVPGLTGVLELSADYYHTCAIRSDGGLYCTGLNGDRQTHETSGSKSSFIKRTLGKGVPALSRVTTGRYTTCAGAGTNWGCVGNSTNGAMGNGSTSDAVSLVPVIANKQPIASIGTGNYAHYALNSAGDIWGAGRDTYGSFGLGKTASSRLKYVATGYGKSVDVDGGLDHSCALQANGSVKCAGYNFYGQLGNGATSHSNVPVLVAAPCSTAATCNDGDPCTADACVTGACVYKPASGASCTDGNACTTADVCQAGKCVGKAVVCDDKNACTVGDACFVDAKGLATCKPGVLTKCNDNDKCTSDSCDAVTGKCVFKPIDGCTQTCKIDADCDDQNQCTQNSCAAGVCVKKLSPDGMLCAEAKVCSSGACQSPSTGWASKITANAEGSHICALGRDTKVYCWGSGSDYRTGQSSTAAVRKPTAVPGITGATDVIAGYSHTCAKVSGKWWCWGDNFYGALGTGATGSDTSKPVELKVVKDPVMLSAGYRHTCALRQDGTVFCWGYRSGGRLGSGVNTFGGDAAGKQVKGVAGAVHIWTAGAHSCALTQVGTVYCWGSNGDRRINDTLSPSTYYAAAQKAGVAKASSVSGGLSTVCWAGGGSGWCTGDNDNGQLGNGTKTDNGKPVAVVGPKGVVMVSGGGDHTTALTMTGALWMSGDNDNGQLGNGTKTDATKFAQSAIPGKLPVIQVRSGRNFTCALLGDGTVVCTGDNASGQQGDGTTADDTTFSAASGPCSSDKQCNDGNPCTTDACVSGQCTFKANTAPCSDGKGCTQGDACSGGSCVGKPVVCDDKNACTVGDKCVEGSDGKGQCVVGKLNTCNDNNSCTADSCDPKTGGCTNAPIAGCTQACKADPDCEDGNPCTKDSCISGKCSSAATGDGLVCAAGAVCSSGKCAPTGKGWAAKISGSDDGSHFCALGTDRKAYCWGFGGDGRLGDGSTGSNYKPTPVNTVSNLADVIACEDHSCALATDGKAYCWGSNAQGQLGTGATSGDRTSPVAVTVAPAFKQLACGYRYTCGIRLDGSVLCWGYGSNGRLGYGSTSFSNQPKGQVVSGLSGAVKLHGFDDHVCAIKSDGTTWCWGENYDKPLQDTSTTRYYKPVQKADAKGARFVHGSTDNVCWGNAGKAWCAGDNDNGQLGNGTSTDSGKGVLIPALVSSVAGGANFNGAVGGDGSLWVVGDNTDGQLGLGTKSSINKWVKSKLPSGAKAVQTAGISDTQCVLSSAGQIYCAGYGWSGRLGHGSTSSADQPTFKAAIGPCTSAAQCDDGNPCTTDDCASGSCAYKAKDGGSCSDGLACTTGDICSGGSCSGKAVLCDDKNACTIGDKCTEGKGGLAACVPGVAKPCNDGNPCTADSCDKVSGGCKFAPIKGCLVGCKSDADCNDNNTCTQDLCDKTTGACTLKPANDGAVCGQGALCSAGKCAAITKGWAKAIAADAGSQHVCALRHNKTVACWGRNDDGQLGNGTKTFGATRKPVVVGGVSEVKQLAVGYEHVCALREDGKLYCWGYNTYGQCGTGVASSTDLTKATLASAIPPLSAVWAGYHTTCGRTLTGSMICWGYGSSGDRGDGTTTSSGAKPIAVKGLPTDPIVQVELSYRRRCVLTNKGEMFCWGNNSNRDVGTTTSSTVSSATKRSNISGVALMGGGSGSVCAMLPAITAVKCWGDNDDGELGYGGKSDETATPQTTKGLMAQPVLMTGGDDHMLYLTTAGKIYAAGDALYYQLGNGSSSDKTTITLASQYKGTYVDLVGAYNTTCALGTDGEVYCVGYNNYGTVGSGSTSTTVSSVTKVVAPQ